MSITAIEDTAFIDLLRYDKDTGKLYWSVPNNGRIKVGQEVGTVTKDGYRRFMYKGKPYLVHRVIWFIEYGSWPSIIDHINRDKLGNRIENLREDTYSQNRYNIPRRSHNKSGYKGVCQRGDRWAAFCDKVYLGTFDTAKDAATCYDIVSRIFHGDFALTNKEILNG